MYINPFQVSLSPPGAKQISLILQKLHKCGVKTFVFCYKITFCCLGSLEYGRSKRPCIIFLFFSFLFSRDYDITKVFLLSRLNFLDITKVVF